MDGFWGVFGFSHSCHSGVSGSYLLFLFGMYDDILNALASLDWKAITVFSFGVVFGVLTGVHMMKA